MKLLVFSGFKQSGKDTLANYMIDSHGFQRVAFADPLKDMVADKFDIPRASMDDPERKEAPLHNLPVAPQDPYSLMITKAMFKEFRTRHGKQVDDFYHGEALEGFTGIIGRDLHRLYWTPRALCILEGSTNRAVDSSYWVKQAIKRIEMAELLGVNGIVISDLRYQSEMSQIRTAFGDKATFVRINRFKDSPSSDPSEMNLVDTPHDFEIDNTGEKEAAFGQLESILNSIK